MALTKITAAGLTADLIDETKLADNSIDSEHYNDGSIDTAHLADDAVTADKLANSINTEIAANTAKVTNATHTGEVTGSGALTIANDAVVTARIADDAITLAKMDGLARGKLIVGDASGNPSALAAGSNDNVLTMDANGDVGWEAPAAGGAALTGSTDNTICTVTGANAIQGEADLKWDGTSLKIKGNDTWIRENQFRFNCAAEGHFDHYTTGQKMIFRTSASSGADTNCLEIFSTGNVEVSSGDLVIGTDDKGIKGDSIHIKADDDTIIAKLHKTNSQEFNFNGSKKLDVNNTGISVTGSVTPSGGIYLGGSGGDNYLSDYEKGTWTAVLQHNNGTAVTYSSAPSTTECHYTKIGRMVLAHGYINNFNISGSGTGNPSISLPFQVATGASHCPGTIVHYTCFAHGNVRCLAEPSTSRLDFFQDNSVSRTTWNGNANTYLMFAVTYSSNT